MLAHRLVAVTRPMAQAAPLARAIEARGGRVLLVPMLEIAAADDPTALREAAQHLADYQFAVFVSQNAVAHACPLLLQSRVWPEATRAVAPGPATAQALKAWGVHDVILPAGPFDSETLLQHPALQEASVRGARVVIFRGNGGRELLASGLAARGAVVHRIACYHRARPADVAPLREAIWQGALSALSITSSEALAHLLAELGDDPGLRQVPLFVPHRRIHERARAAGFASVVLTPPGDAGLVAGMEQYFAER